MVTGASAGIGAATVRHLVGSGHAVAFCARDPERVERLAAEFGDGPEVLGVVADMSDAASIDAFLERAEAGLGPADILVNNVGQSPSRNFLRMTDDDWRALFDLNLIAAVRCTRAVLPGMRGRRWGRIVMVGSAAAKLPNAALVDYAASKAAMLATAKALAGRYGRDGVLVNSVLPGLIHTPMWERAAGEIAAATDSTPDEVIERLGKEVPVGRYGTPEEVAEVIAFLVGDGASYVNGAAFDVDGGSNPHIL
jgi:NAD(P)-dependent dehydrogenase (short-subunit alcohol dehydrogenase family)